MQYILEQKHTIDVTDKSDQIDEYMIKVIEYLGNDKIQKFLNEAELQEKNIAFHVKTADKSERLKETLDKTQNKGFLCVLRRWNSYTPIMSAQDSIGGGYFLSIGGKNIVIDPGFDYVRNYIDEKFNLVDIDYIFITHAHIDHMADLEAIFSLLFEYNEQMPRDNYKKIDLFMNLGSLKKISSWIDLKYNYINRIHVIEANQSMEIAPNLHVIPTEAMHNEILDKIYAVGLIFQYNDYRIGFTGDTGWKQDGSLAKPFENINILVAHLGSIYPSEFKEKDRLHKNHLGLLGISGMIGRSKPELTVISEFGEELKTLRGDIADALSSALNSRCISADVGTQIALSSPPTICCSLCQEFNEKIIRQRKENRIFYICENCQKLEDLPDRFSKC